MILGGGVVVRAVLLVLAMVWCKEVLGRFRTDVAELRARTSWGDRVPTVVVWALTIGIAGWSLATIRWIVAGWLGGD